MLTAEKRYLTDARFKMLVDTLCNAIEKMEMTPTEVREAAMLAQIRYELMHPRPMVISERLAETIRGYGVKVE